MTTPKKVEDNPECIRCGLLKSTILATGKECISSHDFSESAPNKVEESVRERIEHTLDIEQLIALIQGKKLVLDYYGFPNIVLYPPNYGVFLSHEQYQALIGNRTQEEVERIMAKAEFIRKSR